MNKNKAILYASGAVAAIVIVWLILDNNNKNIKLQEFEKKTHEKDKINKQLQAKIENTPEIPLEIKEQLEELIERYRDVDNDVRNELMTASSLIEIKEFTKAIGVLTKIIENLLKDKYADNVTFVKGLKKKKYPVLKDYLDFAREDKLFSAEEYHFANGLREIRNDDAHALNTKQTMMLTSSAFLSAVDLIIKISKTISKI